jgi:hypothetical protein
MISCRRRWPAAGFRHTSDGIGIVRAINGTWQHRVEKPVIAVAPTEEKPRWTPGWSDLDPSGHVPDIQGFAEGIEALTERGPDSERLHDHYRHVGMELVCRENSRRGAMKKLVGDPVIERRNAKHRMKEGESAMLTRGSFRSLVFQ